MDYGGGSVQFFVKTRAQGQGKWCFVLVCRLLVGLLDAVIVHN